MRFDNIRIWYAIFQLVHSGPKKHWRFPFNLKKCVQKINDLPHLYAVLVKSLFNNKERKGQIQLRGINVVTEC